MRARKLDWELWLDATIGSAMIGGGLVGILCLLLWAAASAQVLPPETPEFIRAFTPARGIAALVGALIWSVLFGAIAGAAFIIALKLVRRPRGHA